jgi:hypothetical protein
VDPLEQLFELATTNIDFFEVFTIGDKIANGAFGAVYEVQMPNFLLWFSGHTQNNYETLRSKDNRNFVN